jgi:hypothetical protein
MLMAKFQKVDEIRHNDITHLFLQLTALEPSHANTH